MDNDWNHPIKYYENGVRYLIFASSKEVEVYASTDDFTIIQRGSTIKGTLREAKAAVRDYVVSEKLEKAPLE